MNKKILLIIISVVLILGIACTVFFVFGRNTQTQHSPGEDINIEKQIDKVDWLSVSTTAELEELASKNDKTIEYDLEYAYVSELPFGSSVASYSYKFDSEKNIIGLNVGCVIVGSTETEEAFMMDEIDAQELNNRVIAVMDWVSDNLNVVIGNEYYIITDEGEILDITDVDSYQSIIDGSAFWELRILDTDGSVWVMTIEMIEGYNIISCIFEHCPSDSAEANIPCNVTIE